MMKAEDVRYWLEVHSKCRSSGDKDSSEPRDFEWYMKDVDIVRFCDEVAAAHESDLAAAQERLAEMREALKEIAKMNHAPIAQTVAKDALSAAPAGGRVLFRGVADAWETRTGYSIGLDWVEWTPVTYVPSGGLTESIASRRRVIVSIHDVTPEAEQGE